MNNIPVEYAEFVEGLCKSGADIITSLTPDKAHLLHMAVGVSGEAGELLDAIKKHVVYNMPLNLDNVIEELGDIEFYMQGLRNNLELFRSDIIIANRNKLSIRYSKGTYSDKQAQDREDKEV